MYRKVDSSGYNNDLVNDSVYTVKKLNSLLLFSKFIKYAIYIVLYTKHLDQNA